jgi:hypothetical protein
MNTEPTTEELESELMRKYEGVMAGRDHESPVATNFRLAASRLTALAAQLAAERTENERLRGEIVELRSWCAGAWYDAGRPGDKAWGMRTAMSAVAKALDAILAPAEGEKGNVK